MTKPMTGTREEWLAARLDLLEAEEELGQEGRPAIFFNKADSFSAPRTS